MEKFSSFIQKAFAVSSLFLVLGLAFGFEYSLNLLGYFLPSSIITAPNARSVHVSLMLYGFVPLMLSFLPFVLMEKEHIHSEKGLEKLKIYFTLWCIFLVFMTLSLLMGVHRGLVFYDFAYELNFILAFSGLFYILALYDYIKVYKVIPLWIKVSLYLVIASPIALLVLMNPIIGQVEKTIQGPHGDNTLGMSFTLIPIFYLLIKLHAKETFVAKYHAMWIIPLVGYIGSVAHRILIGELSYNQEWFFQYLTFCYVPLLLKWLKDANITFKNNPFLVISIYSFLCLWMLRETSCLYQRFDGCSTAMTSLLRMRTSLWVWESSSWQWRWFHPILKSSTNALLCSFTHWVLLLCSSLFPWRV
ncbi:hypothetical protein [Sulfurospirillum diekertiae]|uniref:hypothetical protein n=1 Tax=Sulfurospirillum diekertiae TaxID=1854492 RepID=UPI001E5257F9|nr:hypothetical protein [Sulfurospirillum diekertiae]